MKKQWGVRGRAGLPVVKEHKEISTNRRAGIGSARSKDLTNNILYIPGKRRRIIKALPSIKARLSPKLLDTAMSGHKARDQFLSQLPK